MVRALRRFLTCVRSGEAVTGKRNPLGVSHTQPLSWPISPKTLNKPEDKLSYGAKNCTNGIRLTEVNTSDKRLSDIIL